MVAKNIEVLLIVRTRDTGASFIADSNEYRYPTVNKAIKTIHENNLISIFFNNLERFLPINT